MLRQGLSPGKLERLGEIYIACGYANQKTYAFLATGLTPSEGTPRCGRARPWRYARLRWRNSSSSYAKTSSKMRRLWRRGRFTRHVAAHPGERMRHRSEAWQEDRWRELRRLRHRRRRNGIRHRAGRTITRLKHGAHRGGRLCVGHLEPLDQVDSRRHPLSAGSGDRSAIPASTTW